MKTKKTQSKSSDKPTKSKQLDSASAKSEPKSKSVSRLAPFNKSQGKQGKPTTMADLLDSTGYNIPTLRRNQEVSGRVIALSHTEVLIDIGAKSEGIVFGRELASVRDIVNKLAVGDSIEATVVYPENDAGQVVLSLRKHSGEKRWLDLENMRKGDEDVSVVALEVNRGGIICDFAGIRGFLPASQLAQAPSRLADLIGKNLTVKVIEVDRNTSRLIFSQKSQSRKDLKELSALLAKIKIGEKYKGLVSAVLPFGIFVEIDVGKVTKETKEPKEPKEEKVTSKLEGLVHVSELAWEKVEDPQTLFKVADKVDVIAIAKDETAGRLNLSIRQLMADPFDEVSSQYSKDQNVTGTVSRITPYGVFVTLAGGIEGLVHVSKIPPNESWEAGKSVDCIVDSIDTKMRRISLIPVAHEKPILYR